MGKQVLGVIFGYMIFVISALLLFNLTGVNPHEDASLGFILATVVYGTFFSFLSGFAVQYIARKRTLSANYVLALIMAGFATFSFFKSDGSHWTQVLAILVFAPISVYGGLFYLQRYKK